MSNAATEQPAKIPDRELRRLIVVDVRVAEIERVLAKGRAKVAALGDRCLSIECVARRPYEGRKDWTEYWLRARIREGRR